MEGTNQAVATADQTSSPMPTSVAQNSASQPAMSAPSTYQASAQAPAYQQQASAQTANPWQEAFQALSASLSTPSQSQAPVQSSAYQTPTPQVSSQASWASQVAPQPTQVQHSAQTYSAQEVQSLLSQQAQANQAQSASAGAPDAYLSQISDQSLEVLEHFGAEAPALLNQYACAVEDALIEQVQRGQQMNTMLDAAGEERNAMNIMLTNPDVLAEYVNDFFGPEGPYPTETTEETAQREQMEAHQQLEQEIMAQEQRQVPANFQRPTMDMPTPGQRAGNEAASFWGDFSQMMDNNPENAWQYLAQAPQGALQAKMLVQEG